MTLLKFISKEGVENEVDDTSVAAELMRGDPSFILSSIDGEKQPVTAIEPQPEETLRSDSEAVSSPINAKMMRELIEVEEGKHWKALGFKSFAAYLSSDKVPHFGKTKFYKLKDQLLAEGDERFDFINRHRSS